MRKPNNLPATTSASASNYTITSAGPQGPQTYTYPHTDSGFQILLSGLLALNANGIC